MELFKIQLNEIDFETKIMLRSCLKNNSNKLISIQVIAADKSLLNGGAVSADAGARERSWQNGGVHQQARAQDILQKQRRKTHWSPHLKRKVHTCTGHGTRVCGA